LCGYLDNQEAKRKNMPLKSTSRIMRRAIKAAGGLRKLATALGVTHPAVRLWRRIPAELVVKAEAVTGIPREELRPDLYR
jgi:DNA-binding transcriptional regulator YdaS (Cro superfamily)